MLSCLRVESALEDTGECRTPNPEFRHFGNGYAISERRPPNPVPAMAVCHFDTGQMTGRLGDFGLGGPLSPK